MTYNYLEVSQEYFKLRIFPLELKDKAKEWFRSVGQGFTSWSEMEKYFFKKFYSFGKTNTLRGEIGEFTHGRNNFIETWERFMALSRRCPHHGIRSWELAQTFYGVLNDNE